MESETKYTNNFGTLKEVLKAKHFSRSKRVESALNSFLYRKYSSSQNYFYTKEIGFILAESRVSSRIIFIDMQHYLQEDNLLKRVYLAAEQPAKLNLLTEYYKYHEDVPRLFMVKLAQIVHNFYDKKRRINYIRITKLLKGKLDEKINIHDSESLGVSSKSVGYSLHQLLPPELKQALPLPTDKPNTSRSFTLHELNEALTAAMPCKPEPTPLFKPFLKNKDLKAIMMGKLKNENFIKKLISSRNGISPEQRASIRPQINKTRSPSKIKSTSQQSRKVQNLNINNLNININFSSLSKNQIRKRPAEKANQAADSPTFSVGPRRLEDLSTTLAKPPRSREPMGTQYASPSHQQFRSLPQNIISFKKSIIPHNCSAAEEISVSHRRLIGHGLRGPFWNSKTNRVIECTKASGTIQGKTSNQPSSKALKFKKFLQQEGLERAKAPSISLKDHTKTKKLGEFDKHGTIKPNSPLLKTNLGARPSLDHFAHGSSKGFGSSDKLFEKRKDSNQLVNNKKSSRATMKNNPSGLKIFISQDLNKFEKNPFEKHSGSIGKGFCKKNLGLKQSQAQTSSGPQSPTEIKKIKNMHLYFEELSRSNLVNYRTFGSGQKLLEFDPHHNTNCQTMNYLTLFNKKRSMPDTKTKVNFERSIKGILNRKTE